MVSKRGETEEIDGDLMEMREGEMGVEANLLSSSVVPSKFQHCGFPDGKVQPTGAQNMRQTQELPKIV